MKTLESQQIPLSECAARWHPQIGWMDAHLDPEAVLVIKEFFPDE